MSQKSSNCQKLIILSYVKIYLRLKKNFSFINIKFNKERPRFTKTINYSSTAPNKLKKQNKERLSIMKNRKRFLHKFLLNLINSKNYIFFVNNLKLNSHEDLLMFESLDHTVDR